jgi:SAM-dependent methyltransferase
MSVDDSYKKAAAFWDRESTTPTHVSWMENSAVREYINGSFGGTWPLDWFQAEFPGLRFDRALSIGCGTGGLERDLIRRDLCGRIFALDGSIQSLAIARREAEASGMSSRISYFASDFNEPILTPPPEILTRCSSTSRCIMSASSRNFSAPACGH